MKDKDTSKNNNKPSSPKNLDKDTKELLRGALAAFLKEQATEKNESRQNTEALIGVVEEFLNSFIILGYTFDGTPVQYICAHNQQQADSLATLVNKFFQYIMLRNNGPDSED
jgi:mevalonate pyrophosphate decarboxylase